MIAQKTLLVAVSIFSSGLILESATVSALAVTRSPSVSFSSPSEQTIVQNPSTYKVKLGDTVSGIAHKFGLSISQLVEFNPSLRSNPNLIRVGQIINLKPNQTTEKATKTSVSSRPRRNTIETFNISKTIKIGGNQIAGRRGTGAMCFENNQAQLKVLLPDEKVSGYTLRDYPTFFWYLPELTSDSIPLQFTLRPVNGQGGEQSIGSVIYEKTFNNYTPGIERFTLPAEASALKQGQEYEWEIQIKCTKTNVSFIKARIIRESTNNQELANKLENAPIEDYPSILAEAGIWYDALATVSELRQANPQESFWQDDWKKILEKIGFGNIKDVPEQQLNT